MLSLAFKATIDFVKGNRDKEIDYSKLPYKTIRLVRLIKRINKLSDRLVYSETYNLLKEMKDKTSLSDDDFHIYLVSKSWDYLRYIPFEKINREIILTAIQNPQCDLNDVPFQFRDLEICKIAMQHDSANFELVPPMYQKRLMEMALSKNGMLLNLIREEYKTRERCKIAVTNKGRALHFVPFEFRDLEICELAVRQDGAALNAVMNQNIKNKLLTIAVRKDARIIKDIPEKRRKKYILEAVKSDGAAIKYAAYVPDCSAELMRSLIYISLSQNGNNLKYINREQLTYAMYFKAVSKTGKALKFVPKEFRTRRMCIAAFENDPRAIIYTPDNIFKTLTAKYANQSKDLSNKTISRILDRIIQLKNMDYDISITKFLKTVIHRNNKLLDDDLPELLYVMHMDEKFARFVISIKPSLLSIMTDPDRSLRLLALKKDPYILMDSIKDMKKLRNDWTLLDFRYAISRIFSVTQRTNRNFVRDFSINYLNKLNDYDNAVFYRIEFFMDILRHNPKMYAELITKYVDDGTGRRLDRCLTFISMTKKISTFKHFSKYADRDMCNLAYMLDMTSRDYMPNRFLTLMISDSEKNDFDVAVDVAMYRRMDLIDDVNARRVVPLAYHINPSTYWDMDKKYKHLNPSKLNHDYSQMLQNPMEFMKLRKTSKLSMDMYKLAYYIEPKVIEYYPNDILVFNDIEEDKIKIKNIVNLVRNPKELENIRDADIDACLISVLLDPMSIQHVPENIMNTEEGVVLRELAIFLNPFSILKIDKKYQTRNLVDLVFFRDVEYTFLKLPIEQQNTVTFEQFKKDFAKLLNHVQARFRSLNVCQMAYEADGSILNKCRPDIAFQIEGRVEPKYPTYI